MTDIVMKPFPRPLSRLTHYYDTRGPFISWPSSKVFVNFRLVLNLFSTL